VVDANFWPCDGFNRVPIDTWEDSMRTTRWLAVAAATGSISAGVAFAASHSAETSAVTADFQASPTAQRQRQCDVSHVLFRVRFEGSQTSSDPRLSGTLVARVRSVVNTNNGYGYTEGRVRISDASTGRPKLNGHVVGVLAPDGGAEGLLTGRTVGPNSAQLIANFNVKQDQSTGAITGELGKDTQSGAFKDPAVLTNACRGERGEHGHKPGDRAAHGEKSHRGGH
jgi:hypothetical protein